MGGSKNMIIKMNKDGDGELSFSWKEIFILLKKRKLTLNENVLDQFTVELIKLKHSLIESRKNVDK